jgi:Kef-type K+ transport system membrane component KefB
MRRGFVVLALLAMMVGLKALKAEAPGGADPLTLAAIGFVVLAAFAVAELGAKLQLPKVTGYILSGVVLGPYAARVLTTEVVVELKMFSTLALGLIATSAGLELDLKGLRALARTLSVTTAVKIVTGIVLVGGTVVAIELGFGVLGLASEAEILAIAIVLAALSLGTSPSVTLAILSDTHAKGRLADLVLGAAVVKDVVVVVLLALAIATAKSLTGGGGIGIDVLVHVGEELGASALAGGVLGALLILYVRYVKAEMLLFVAAMVLVVAQVGVVLRLDLLLVFIVAGLVVRNFSSYAHDLLHPLETVSLPVFIVFFTNAGANVDLEGLAAVLPLALAVCTARAVGYVLASRIGGRAGGESAKIRKIAWLGYLPQAGVTLGLLGVATSQLPELAPALGTIGMAVLAVNLLVGPVTLRAALRSAGEIPGQQESVSEAAQSMRGIVSHGKPWEGLESEELQAIVRDVAVDGAAAARSFVAREVEPWVEERRNRLLEGVVTTGDRDQALAGITEVLERLPPDDAPSRIDGLLALFAERVATLENIPARLRVPLERRWQRVGRLDPWSVAWRKRWAAFLDIARLRWKERERAVPARMTARTVVEPALARAIEEVANAWYRAELVQIEELRRCALRTRTPQDASENIEMLGRDFVDRVREDLVGATDRMARALARELGRVGSPVHPASRVRYSKVEPELVRWRARIVDDAENWGRRRDAAVRLARVTAEVALIEQRLGDQLGEQVMAVAEEAFVMVKEEVEAEGRRLTAMVETARAATALDEETMGRLQMQASALVPRPVLKKLRTAGGKLRRATSGGTVATIFRDASIEQAGREAIVHSIAALVEDARPARGEIIGLDIGETIQGYLSADLAPGIEDALGEIWAAFAAAREAMGNCESAAEFVLATVVRESADEPLTPAELASQLESAGEALAPVADAAWAQWETLRGRLTASLGGIDEHLVEAIARAAGRSSATAQALGRRRRAVVFLQAIYAKIAAPLSVAWGAAVLRARGEAAHGIGRHYRLRSGAERADAADVREILREYDPSAAAELPAMYRALFSVDPVRDPRLFVAHREALQEVVRVERAWQQSPVTGNAVLVVAGTGMGKTSLVQVARLKLATRRVVVVPERERVDEPTLLAYVARELGCAADAEAIAAALARGRTAIVVDDLHMWLDLGPPGVRQLDELLSLVVATRSSAFWLLAISREGLEAYEPLLPVRPAFAQVVRLRGVTASELDDVVESRQQLAGLALSFPLGWWARLLDRVLRRSPRESYLRGLAAVSGGNLRRSLRGWLRRASLESDREIRLAPIGVDWGLPFVRQLSAAQLGVLSLLLRFGRRRVPEISDGLAMAGDHVARELRFLAASGLIEERGGWLDVPVQVRDEVSAALSGFGVLPGGEA